MLLEQVGLDDVKHLLHLAEDENAMLRERARGRLLGIDEFGLRRIARCTRRKADAAVDEKLAAEEPLA